MKHLISGAITAAFISASPAVAAPIDVTYQSDGVFGADNLRQVVTISTPGPGFDGNVYAGMFHLTGNQGMGDFLAFCIDLGQYLGNPQVIEETATLATQAVKDNLVGLFNVALDGGSLGDVVNTSLASAALQVAVWEVFYDTDEGFDLSDGAFQMSNNWSVLNAAQTLLDGIGSASTTGYDLGFFYSEDNQDLLTVSAVPLPASGLLLLAGFGGLAAVRRKKRS